jgi:hydroxymethylbilane synthase
VLLRGLALWQANHIADQLRQSGHTVEIEVIRTTGDRMQQPGFVVPPDLDGKGIFIKEIEEALAAGRIDVAVHSYKDLPTCIDPRFVIAAVPTRADARDAFVCEPYWALHTLPLGGRIGTTSPRRRAQLLALRPDLTFVNLRGNIDTRLRKLEQGECDALVLACAGLDRLGRNESVHQRFDLDELTPAPGQGALALETRSPEHPLTGDIDAGRDAEIFAAIERLDDWQTRFCTDAERAFLAAMGGGCELPLGAHCFVESSRWRIFAQVLSPDGEAMVQIDTEASPSDDPVSLGEWCANDLKQRGALDLLAS